MTLLSMSSCSSVDRAPARCSGGHGFNSCWGLRIFLCPMLVSCWLIHLHISLPSLKFTIFINLSRRRPVGQKERERKREKKHHRFPWNMANAHNITSTLTKCDSLVQLSIVYEICQSNCQICGKNMHQVWSLVAS